MKKKLFFLLPVFLLFLQCKKEDTTEPIPIRDYSEQVIVDQDLLETYLKTHTYNYEDFNNESDVNIKLDTISDNNSSRVSLFEQASIKTIDVTNAEGQITSHNLYYIIAREGSNESPSVADSVYVAYNGILTDGSSFDNSKFPIWIDLANTIEGFREGVSELRTGKFTENSNGTIAYTSFGVGLFFIPSGIGYFENINSGIPEYSPLIFTVKLMTHTDTDHDNDGILSIFEDIDGDNKPFGDDSDGDNLWNMYDVDDDGDGILTVNEIDKNNDSIIDDTNNDGIPDYLDPDN
jgi:FKBP-type peptidyl-prolyl cis-trans isomerase